MQPIRLSIICSLLPFWPHFKLVAHLFIKFLVAPTILFLEQTWLFLPQGLVLTVGFAYHPLSLVLHITEASEQMSSQASLPGLLNLYYYHLLQTMHTTSSYFISFIMYLSLFEIFSLIYLFTYFYQSHSTRMQAS